MSNVISFSIQNPNATPAGDSVVYLGQDNTLQFVFTNNGLGNYTLTPQDTFTIIIPGTLLASASADQLESTDWVVKSLTQPTTGAGIFTFELRPKADIPFNSKKPVSVVFQHWKGKKSGNDDVQTHYSIGGNSLSGSGEKLFVQPPPDQPGDLNDVITFEVSINDDQLQVPRGTVYSSPQSLTPPIANRIHLNLTYSGSSLAESWDQEYTPQFIISFSYGDNDNDLTNALQEHQQGYNALTSAWKIHCSVESDESSLWMPPPTPDTTAGTPSWVIEPNGNANIFTDSNPNLDLIFTHVITILPKGNATIYVQWVNIPGYNSGKKALNLPKTVPQPVVLAFSAPNGQLSETCDGDSPVQLVWKTFAASEVEIDWMDQGVAQSSKIAAFDPLPQLIYSGGSSSGITTVDRQCAFNLTAIATGGSASQQAGPVMVYKTPKIDTFTAVIGYNTTGNAHITFGWSAENVRSCTIQGIVNGLGSSSDKDPYVHHLDSGNTLIMTYTLIAYGANNQQDTLTVQGSFYLENTVQLPMGMMFPNSIAIMPDASMAFVVGQEDLQYINYFNPAHLPATTSAVSTRSMFPDHWPTRMAINADGSRAFVVFTNWYNAQDNDFILFFDPRELGQLANYASNVVKVACYGCDDIKVSADNHVFVTMPGTTTIGVFDGNNPPAAITTLIPFVLPARNGNYYWELMHVLLTPDGTRGFVTNGSNVIAWFDFGNGTASNVTYITSTGEYTTDFFTGLSITPDGKKVLVNGLNGGFIFDAINPPVTLTQWSVRGPVTELSAILPNGLIGMLLNGSYVSSNGNNLSSFSWFELNNLPVTNTYPTSFDFGAINTRLYAVAVAPDSARIFVTMAGGGGGAANITVFSIRFAPQQVVQNTLELFAGSDILLIAHPSSAGGTPVNFAIDNPEANGDPVLYLGQDNTLQFVFTNNGLGNYTLTPQDTFTIIIPGTLLASASADQLSSTDWVVKSLTQPSNSDANFTFELRPKADIPFNSKKPVSVVFQHWKGKKSGNDDVQTHYSIGGNRLSGSGEKLFVQDPLNQPRNLPDDLTFTQPYINDDQNIVQNGKVYITDQNLALPIDNRIHLNLTYGGIALVEAWDPSNKPNFIISFSYGNNAGDLTDALKQGAPDYNPVTSAWSLKCQVKLVQNSLWKLLPPDTASATPSWTIEPVDDNTSLFTRNNSSLDIIISSVITRLAEGNATVYIQWGGDIPGYNPGWKALNLEKQLPTLQLIKFDSTQTKFTIHDVSDLINLVLQWEMTNVAKITLDFNFPNLTIPSLIIPYTGQQPVLQKEDAYNIPFPLKGFEFSGALLVTCTASSVDGQQSQSSSTTIHIDFPPEVTGYTGDVQSDGSLLLSWTTKGATGVSIPGILAEKLDANGTKPVLGSEFLRPLFGNPAYAITAHGPNEDSAARNFQHQTWRTVATVPLLADTGKPLAVTPDNKYILVVNVGTSNTITVIEVGTFNVVATVTVGTSPISIAAAPDSSRIFVSNQKDNTVSVIEAGTFNVIETVRVGDWPLSVAASAHALVVANEQSPNVMILDPQSLENKGLITVGSSPWCVAVSSDGHYAFVMDLMDKTVSVIDLSLSPTHLQVIKTIPVDHPWSITASPENKYVFVVNNGPSNVQVIAIDSWQIVQTIPAGSSPWAIAVTSDNTYAFLADEQDNTVTVINLATLQVINTITQQNNLTGDIAISPDNNFIYLVSFIHDMDTGEFSISLLVLQESVTL